MRTLVIVVSSVVAVGCSRESAQRGREYTPDELSATELAVVVPTLAASGTSHWIDSSRKMDCKSNDDRNIHSLFSPRVKQSTATRSWAIKTYCCRVGILR